MASISNGGNTIHPIVRKGPIPPAQTIVAPSGGSSIVPNPVVRRAGTTSTIRVPRPLGGGTSGGGLATLKPIVPIMRSRGPVVPVVHENHLPQFNATVRTFGGDEAMGFGKFGT